MATRRNILRLLFGAMIAGSLCAAAAAQQAAPPKKPAPPEEQAKPEAPAVIPSAALGLGGKMEESAAPESLKWARGYAKREILDRRPPPEDAAIRKALDARYPAAPASARAAGVFLLWYLAYQHASRAQEDASRPIQDMERDINKLEDDLLRIRNTPVPLSQASAAHDAEDRAAQRLEDALHQQNLHKRNLNALRARVDVCLKRLAALYETLKDSDPAEVRQLK